MDSAQLQQILDDHVYMWFHNGPSLEGHVPIGYHRIKGRQPGQDIQINNYGTVERPDFRCLLWLNGEIQYESFHFASEKEALEYFLDWSEKVDPLPALRECNFFGNFVAYAVDGYKDGLDVMVVEFEPGRFQLRIAEEGRGVRYEQDDRWKCPMDALTL